MPILLRMSNSSASGLLVMSSSNRNTGPSRPDQSHRGLQQHRFAAARRAQNDARLAAPARRTRHRQSPTSAERRSTFSNRSRLALWFVSASGTRARLTDEDLPEEKIEHEVPITDAVTIACVVARPTPWVPPVARNP